MARRGKAKVEKSAGGVVVRTIEGVPHVLVIRDPYRETGLTHLELGQELATIDWYFRAGEKLIHKFCVFYLMASERGEPVPQLSEGITACAWVPMAEAEDRITYGNAREVVRTAREVLAGSSSESEEG